MAKGGGLKTKIHRHKPLRRASMFVYPCAAQLRLGTDQTKNFDFHFSLDRLSSTSAMGCMVSRELCHSPSAHLR